MSKITEYKQNYRVRVKAEMIEITGGKCQVCGYNKSASALEFHHLDPSEKEFALSSSKTGTMSREQRFSELRKCILLCANCHRELHAGLIDDSNLKVIFEEELYDKYVKGLIAIRIKTCSKCGGSITGEGKTGLCTACYKESARVAERPSREELKQMIRKIPFTQIALKFSVSDNAIRKWCKNYNLPSTKIEIKQLSNEEWELI